jgi:hypothetical protein
MPGPEDLAGRRAAELLLTPLSKAGRINGRQARWHLVILTRTSPPGITRLRPHTKRANVACHGTRTGSQLDQRCDGAGRGRSMLAFRSVVSVLLRELGDSSLHPLRPALRASKVQPTADVRASGLPASLPTATLPARPCLESEHPNSEEHAEGDGTEEGWADLVLVSAAQQTEVPDRQHDKYAENSERDVEVPPAAVDPVSEPGPWADPSASSPKACHAQSLPREADQSLPRPPRRTCQRGSR